MLIRVVLLFLIFMVAVGMIHKALRPNARLTTRRRQTPDRPTLDGLRCPACKRVNLNTPPAPCERPECGYRT